MTREELNRQSAVCKRCNDGYYCPYHAAWNSLVVAMEGQCQINESKRRATARQSDPVAALTLEERLVASIAVANYRRKEVA